MLRKTFYSLLALLLLSSYSQAAYWLGNAQDTPQITTITVADTWASDDTFSLICNNKTLTLTCGSTMDTTAEVAAGIAEMVMSASHQEDDLTADMTINAGGREYGEFYDMEATVSGSVVTLKSAKAGVPFTVTKAETTAGTGSTTLSTTQSATGKHWFDNADNWSTGAVPTAGGDATFLYGSVDVKYGLGNIADDIDFKRLPGYTGNIGLPDINTTTPPKPYTEYREKYFTSSFIAANTQQYEINSVRGWTRIDLGTDSSGPNNLDVIIYNTPEINSDGQYGVEIIGGLDVDLVVYDGNIGIALEFFSASEYTLLKTFDLLGPATVFCGNGTYLSNGVTPVDLTMTDGTLTVDHNSGGLGGSLEITGGTVSIYDDIDDITISSGGKAIFFGGDATTVDVMGGGEVNCNMSSGSTFTNINLYQGFTFRDRNGKVTYSNGVDFEACAPTDGVFEVNESQTWTPSAL